MQKKDGRKGVKKKQKPAEGLLTAIKNQGRFINGLTFFRTEIFVGRINPWTGMFSFC